MADDHSKKALIFEGIWGEAIDSASVLLDIYDVTGLPREDVFFRAFVFAAVQKEGGSHYILAHMSENFERVHNLYIHLRSGLQKYDSLVTDNQVADYEHSVRLTGGHSETILQKASEEAGGQGWRRLFYLGTLEPTLEDVPEYIRRFKGICDSQFIRTQKKKERERQKKLAGHDVQKTPVDLLAKAKEQLNKQIVSFERSIDLLKDQKDELLQERARQLKDILEGVQSLKAQFAATNKIVKQYNARNKNPVRIVHDGELPLVGNGRKDNRCYDAFDSALQCMYRKHEADEFLPANVEADEELLDLAGQCADLARLKDELVFDIAVYRRNLEHGGRVCQESHDAYCRLAVQEDQLAAKL
ncbi:MAG: FlxA-like family protein [Rhodospirillales bacterium]|nr:FlxA-like family protein [Rhodospirillales bacterium]